MKPRLTIQDLERLKSAGKIRGFVLEQKKEPKPGKIGGRIVTKHYFRKNEALNWMGLALFDWCSEHGLILHEEYRFYELRRWRFDWCIESLKVAIEYEGGIFQENSGHKTAKHYTKDANKYNKASELGWKVLRYTALNYRNVLDDLSKLIV